MCEGGKEIDIPNDEDITKETPEKSSHGEWWPLPAISPSPVERKHLNKDSQMKKIVLTEERASEIFKHPT